MHASRLAGRLLPPALCVALFAGCAVRLQLGDGLHFKTGAHHFSAESNTMIKQYHSESEGADRDYWLSLPAGYEAHPGKKWPLILFLHGAGERGDDIQKVLKHGPIMEVKVKQRDLPFVIVAPQMPDSAMDERRSSRTRSRPDRKDGEMKRETLDEFKWSRTGPLRGWPAIADELIALVDATIRDYNIDPDRVYLTGLSMGGFGSFYLAAHHPGRWAAVAPICGGHDPAQASGIGATPIWIFHGGRDSTVPVECSLAMANAIEEAGGNVRFTVHEELQHNSWERVYQGADIYDWFLSHKRGGAED